MTGLGSGAACTLSGSMSAGSWICTGMKCFASLSGAYRCEDVACIYR